MLPLMVLQQYLPLAVLKRCYHGCQRSGSLSRLQQYLPLAVLKPPDDIYKKNINIMLQQYLPLAVLKPYINQLKKFLPLLPLLQQYLPLAVLKLE